MTTLTKNRKAALSKIEKGKLYELKEAVRLVKDITYTKFNASVDIDVRLGVDPKKANQMVRGVSTLPHGTGKELKVLVLCNPDVEEAAREAGADYVGLDTYLDKIKDGWTDVDIIITSPDIMPKLGRFGKILGPRGLMPNPKSGTVTNDIPKAVREVKSGKIDFKVDKYGIIHTTVGRVSFTPEQLFENVNELVQTIQKLRPAAAKGAYFKGITLSSTMSPGIEIDIKSIPGI
ncbi:MAG TPA: 50S ribosomal protein L1 [Bacteroidia bacterium]|nr:50S ribosomal protein L1 [Bacteroidia bacterium]HRS59018.1 50S ribosomal protein L1 [Bacteroidia bacterium]HRU68102.1 50S ribosomal protein L1 [Bacteroidia bacterium]